ncbi:MAG: DUF2341 domain-containing protein [Spirochaetes bacterium]|nr:DUF2341 domain-containing protein [Spirochaetota bacterium]
MLNHTKTSARILPGIFILLAAFLGRCSDGMDVLLMNDRSFYTVAFLHGDVGSADLENLEISSGTLSPGFDSNTTYYTAVIDETVATVSVTPTAVERTAAILVGKDPEPAEPVSSGQPSGDIDMANGENVIEVNVTSYDGLLTRTYFVNVFRCDLDNADLIDLSLSDGSAVPLDPSFATGTYSYTAYVDSSVPSITVTPTADEEYATIRVNGTVVVSGQPSPDIDLSPGENTITVDVLSFDGSVSRTYTINAISCEPGNADLSDLVLSTGTLSPGFDPDTLSYISYIHESVMSLTVAPIAADQFATMTVNGSEWESGQPYGVSTPANGDYSVTIVVTSPDGSVAKTYTLTITRLNMFSTNLLSMDIADQATLTTLVLSPDFNKGQTVYTATIDTSVLDMAAVTVTPVAESGGLATITVNGESVPSGSTSSGITMNHGINTITVYVTNGAAAPQTYTVTITKYNSTNADLSNLALSNGTLNPVFDAGTISYTAEVTASSITVTPTLEESYASVTVNGNTVTSGQPSQSIPMAIGDNLITVTVTAQNGTTTRTYTVTATRTAILPTDFISGRSIRLDTTSSGADVTSTITNFPVLIRLTDSSIIQSLQTDWDDLRFLWNDGVTWLNYEIERWDIATNRAEVWVLVPTIAGNSNTYLTMYYNDVINGAVPAASNPGAVFNASNGFAAVYHMNNNPAGGTGAIKNSSSNPGLDGTSAGSMTSGDLIESQVAGGLDFDGTNDQINLGTSGLLQPANLTASFWVKKPGSLLGFFIYRNFLCMKSSRSENGWYIDFSPGLAVGLGAVPFEFYVDGNNNGFVLTPTLISFDWLSSSEWVMMTVSFNTTSNTCDIFFNGELQNGMISGEVGSPNTITATGDTKYIAGGNFNSNLKGGMDEVRIQSVVRSVDWVKLEYENQKTNQSLVKF